VESQRRGRAEELAKEGMPNPVLQRSARSEGLHLEPGPPARPLTTSLDRRGVVEVKWSAADGESKKRLGGVVS
jgi:hypothetical protein